MRDELEEQDKLDEARAIVAAMRVRRIFLTREAAAALDAADWAEDDLVARVPVGDAGEIFSDIRRGHNDDALGRIEEFDAGDDEDNIEPPAIGAAWRLPGGACAQVVVEIGRAVPLIGVEDEPRPGTAYIFLF